MNPERSADRIDAHPTPVGGVGLTLSATGMVFGALAFVVVGIGQLLNGGAVLGVVLLVLGLLGLGGAGYLVSRYRRLMRRRRAGSGVAG